MTKMHEVYKCNQCDNVVEVKQAGDGELVCCGEPMQLMSPEEASPFLTPTAMKPGGP